MDANDKQRPVSKAHFFRFSPNSSMWLLFYEPLLTVGHKFVHRARSPETRLDPISS